MSNLTKRLAARVLALGSESDLFEYDQLGRKYMIRDEPLPRSQRQLGDSVDYKELLKAIRQLEQLWNDCVARIDQGDYSALDEAGEIADFFQDLFGYKVPARISAILLGNLHLSMSTNDMDAIMRSVTRNTSLYRKLISRVKRGTKIVSIQRTADKILAFDPSIKIANISLYSVLNKLRMCMALEANDSVDTDKVAWREAQRKLYEFLRDNEDEFRELTFSRES